MGLGKSVEGITLFLDEDCQIILVDLFFRIIIIFPDKTAILPVLRNRRIADDFPVFIICIKIKDKNATGVEIIVHQPEYLQKFLFFQNIIDGITDADHRTNSRIQIQFPHILMQIEDLRTALRLFLHGNAQHLFRIVHADAIIPFLV